MAKLYTSPANKSHNLNPGCNTAARYLHFHSTVKLIVAWNDICFKHLIKAGIWYGFRNKVKSIAQNLMLVFFDFKLTLPCTWKLGLRRHVQKLFYLSWQKLRLQYILLLNKIIIKKYEEKLQPISFNCAKQLHRLQFPSTELDCVTQDNPARLKLTDIVTAIFFYITFYFYCNFGKFYFLMFFKIVAVVL